MTLYELLEVMGEVDGVCDTIYDWTVDTYYELADIETGKKERDLYARSFDFIIYNNVKLEKRQNGVVVANFTEYLESIWNKLEAPIEKYFNIDLTDKKQAIEDFLYYVLSYMLHGEYSEKLYKDFVDALLHTEENTATKERRYTGTIYEQDIKEFGLPKHCQMKVNGFWQNGSKKQASYIFADGSHPEMQFSKDRNNVFYLEAVN